MSDNRIWIYCCYVFSNEVIIWDYYLLFDWICIFKNLYIIVFVVFLLSKELVDKDGI